MIVFRPLTTSAPFIRHSAWARLKSPPRFCLSPVRKSRDAALVFIRASAAGRTYRRDGSFAPRPNRRNWRRRSRPRGPSTCTPRPGRRPAADTHAGKADRNVATLTGKASVKRNEETTPLKIKDDIYLNDVVQTRPFGARRHLQRRHHLQSQGHTEITIDNYVYEDGGKKNAACSTSARAPSPFVAARWRKPAT